LRVSDRGANRFTSLVCFFIRNDICHENLPASSTYYKTSASKAKILNLVKEKIADGEIVPGEEFEDINTKKVICVFQRSEVF